MMGTIGRARNALPVAMAADTPQMEMPEASGAAHSRLFEHGQRPVMFSVHFLLLAKLTV